MILLVLQNDLTDEYNADPEGTLNDNTSGVNTPNNPNGQEGVIDLDASDPANEGVIDLDSGSSNNSNTNNSIPNNVQNTEKAGSFDEFWGQSQNQGESPPNEAQAAANNQAGAGKEKKLDTAKILAKLLGEENYFNALKQDDEFIYNSLKRQLKHFHPALSLYDTRRFK